MLTKVSMKTARDFTLKALTAGLVPFISSSPGMGKSAMIRSVAKTNNLKLIDIRLAQTDPCDLVGFPKLDDGRSEFCPPKTFPLEDLDTVPEGYKGWLVFFDEINAAPRAVQAAAYKILLEREIGTHKLHSKVFLACAGNLMTDGAITNEMGTALRSRLIHIHVESHSDEFLEVAAKLKFDTRVIAYLNYQKHKVNNFIDYQRDSADETFACQRTWEFVSKLSKSITPDETQPIPLEYYPLLQGTVGSSALEYVQFTQALDGMVQFKDILKAPKVVPVPEKPSVMYLLCGMLGANTEEKHIVEICEYVTRLPKEFQMIFVRIMLGKHQWCMEKNCFLDIVDELGELLYG